MKHSLEKIADALDQLAGILDEPDGSVDPFDLRHLARQVRAQGEMLDKGLAE